MAPPVAKVDVFSKEHLIKKGDFEMGTTTKCPSCGNNMEYGYLVGSLRISWCDNVPRVFCGCGEILSKTRQKCAHIEGYRCKRCRIILYESN